MNDNNVRKIAPSSRDFFEKGMLGHHAVEDISFLGDDVYLIERTGGRSNLRVLVADIYIAGEADIIEIAQNHGKIDCIVLVGFYNRYSSFAKSLAQTMGIALFDKREFFGALNFSGDKFMNYEKHDKD